MGAVAEFFFCTLLFAGVTAQCLSCAHVDSSGCVFNISLKESCELLANTLVPQSSDAEIYGLLQSISKKLDNVQGVRRRASKCKAVANRLEEPVPSDAAGSDDDEAILRHVQGYVNHVKVQRETLKSENFNLQDSLSAVAQESRQNLQMVNELFDKENECQNQKNQLLLTLSDKDRWLSNLRHTSKKLREENSQLLRYAQELEKVQADLKLKLAAATSFVAQVSGRLSVTPPTVTDSEPEVWRQYLDLLYITLIDVMGESGTMQTHLENLREENSRLTNSLLQKESALQTSASCEAELNALKMANDLISARLHRLEDGPSGAAAPAKAVTSCVTSVKSTYCSLETSDPSQDGMCWFERLMTSDYNWQVKRNKDLLHTRYKSLTDHTCGNHHGRFIYLDLARLIVGQEARLTSLVLSSSSTGSQCFSFWYKVHYVFNTGKFFAHVMIMDDKEKWISTSVSVWEQNLGQDNQWQFSKFTVPEHIARLGYKIQFAAEANGPGFIAIDDLSLTDTSCY